MIYDRGSAAEYDGEGWHFTRKVIDLTLTARSVETIWWPGLELGRVATIFQEGLDIPSRLSPDAVP